MNRFLPLVAALLIASQTALGQQPGAPPAAAPPASTAPKLNTLLDRVSYMVGLNMARQMKEEGMKISPEMFQAGLIDGLNGAAPALSDTEMQATMKEFNDQQMGEVLKAENDFFAANAKKEGVIVLPSGLQYKVLKAGTGPTPKLTDTVQAHYTGKLLDGTVFDSSVERGQPATFAVGRVIPGWTEALQKMKAGDKWELFIPSKLAYGPQPPPGIPPNAVLVFEVELLAVEAGK